ncbi:hypothetical protein BDW74DRAFT_171977 [Aspergillus multicolor]|uniref:uncharacterized protein n=1 Tax=Aspergillus multicolor TaxID=41759 RepID=UPI003CCDE5F7
MSTPIHTRILQESHKDWEGLELIALANLHGDPRNKAFHAALLARSLVLYVAATGCNTFSVEIAFWKQTSTWRVALTAKEPIASNLDEPWIDEVASRFRNHAQIDSPSVRRRGINEPAFDDAEDWVKDRGLDGKKLWAHTTWFTCYRGIPFLLKRNGRPIRKEINAFMELRAHDNAIKGVYLGSTRLAPGRTDHRSYLLKVLKAMTDIKPPAGEDTTGTPSPRRSSQVRAPGAGRLPTLIENPCDYLFSALARGMEDLEAENRERNGELPRKIKPKIAKAAICTIARYYSLKVLAVTGCDSFLVTIGFYKPTIQWRLHIEARELNATGLGGTWCGEITARIRGSQSVDRASVRTRDIHDPDFPDRSQ